MQYLKVSKAIVHQCSALKLMLIQPSSKYFLLLWDNRTHRSSWSSLSEKHVCDKDTIWPFCKQYMLHLRCRNMGYIQDPKSLRCRIQPVFYLFCEMLMIPTLWPFGKCANLKCRSCLSDCWKDSDVLTCHPRPQMMKDKNVNRAKLFIINHTCV